MQGTAPRRIAILAPARSPTRDLYLIPRLRDAALPVHAWELGKPCPCEAEGTYVIVVRYLDAVSARWLSRHRGQLAGASLLIDDDVPGAVTDASLPFDYRWRMARYWWRFRRRLFALCDEVWSPSPLILDNFARAGFTGERHRLSPVYCGPPLPRPDLPDSGAIAIFYHGLPTHRGECLWLRDVVVEVQKRREDTLFEIIGRAEIEDAYAGLPRVRVLYPMTYPTYASYMRIQRFDIGLAPLLDTAFNRARSHTKAHDIASVGAAGLHGDTPVYREVIEHDRNGLLLPMDDKTAWADAICALAADGERRRLLARTPIRADDHVPETLNCLRRAAST